MSEVLSCFDPAANPQRMLPVDESIQRILSQVMAITDTERLALPAALDRVLAEDLISPINVPQQTNSAMDGYAVCAAGLNPQQPLHIVGSAYAGSAFNGILQAGEAVEIMTGAPLPQGADTILIKEVCQREGNSLSFTGPVQPGQHVRQAGEDIAAGSLALSQGSRLRPQELGLIASLGHTEVAVYRRLRVAIFSTGDEVVAQGQPLTENCIYDTNRFTLQGMLQRLGCEVIDLGIIEDSQPAMETALSAAAGQADAVISSGGVSMGNADYIKSALEQVGEINFWRIAMRPGRPLAFGQLLNRTPFFGLPGNPVAVMVTFSQFVQPALRKMMGSGDWQPVRVSAVAEEAIRSRAGRTDYSRGIYRIDEQGQLQVRTTGSQGSGILTSMTAANCLIEIGDDKAALEAGDRVLIQPFPDLL
ncbi:bifunctional molybdopterin-guanine dinucleotide biosynthesis adaptor protein MobB/molybdopterin molybdotransferase MoeA [Neptuniibacter halophilus]|uniref:bifunctional molybdopterin-guanine dinucleotide biosynthesis adaptor protein MobB/molybdopterin molybdotransferase MoeA n=1 Tax=Neptuniibacter halophilus TaxID=651666 RepID=UPI002573CCF3|nr:bifunctional molybdopterin-guanine dinucleotide biosynthesis adaptor protein MobB/molybdopterin molybdotransferase MoeA [Neptuniibacter halophilus]